jgi:hypothetical protein
MVIGENTGGNLPFGVQAVAHAAVDGGGHAGDHQEFHFLSPEMGRVCHQLLYHPWAFLNQCIMYISTSRERL